MTDAERLAHLTPVALSVHGLKALAERCPAMAPAIEQEIAHRRATARARLEAALAREAQARRLVEHEPPRAK